MRAYKLKKCKRVRGIHFTPDGSRLLAVGGAEVRMLDTAVWLDLASGENIGRIDQYADDYAVDPALTRLVFSGAEHWTGPWDGIHPIQWKRLPDGDDWHPFPEWDKNDAVLPHLPGVIGMAFDRTGEWFAVGHGRAIRQLQSHSDPRQWEYEVHVQRFDPPELMSRFQLTDAAEVITFNDAATRIAVTGGVDGNTAVEMLDLTTGKQIYRFAPPATVTRCVLFTSDNRLVVANGRYVYVLPPDKPEPLFTLAGHPKQVNAVALTRDGWRILTASHDGTIRVWDAATGQAITSFDWKIGPVTAVAFAPDGLTCAAAGLNGKVVVWDVDQ